MRRLLTPMQRAGAATLPAALPVPARLREIYEQELSAVHRRGWAAVLLAAASHDQALAPLADALAARGLDPARCLDQAAGVLELAGPVSPSGIRCCGPPHGTGPGAPSVGRPMPPSRPGCRPGRRGPAPGRGGLRLRPGAGAGAGGDRTVRGRPARLRGGLGGVRAGGPADARAGRSRGAARAGGGECHLAGDGVRARRLAGEVLDGAAGDADRAAPCSSSGS